ncbi:MAG: RNA polymerase sigma factor [Polyangiaceae bacterium]
MSRDARSRALRLIRGGAAPSEPPASGTVVDQAALSDLQMVSAVRDGNAAAAALFHNRLRPIVDRTLGRLIGSRDSDYDDLTQQALIQLVLSVDRFRGECPLDAWASIIVARVAYKHIRKRRTERKLFVLDRGEVPDVVDRAATGTVAIRSAIRCVEKYLRGMDVNKAWTFVLHDVHGYDLEEVSAITGVSRAAAQSRLVRGRKALHERIAKDPELATLLSDLSQRGDA